MSSTKQPEASTSKAKETAPDVADIDRLLNREATAFQREVEVERILKAFKLNPYDILDIDEMSTAEEVKKRYKQLSLFIHPDKCPHPRSPEAFDILKKAESELSDKAKREELDALINQARNNVLRALSLPLSTKPDDPALKNLTPSFKVRLRAQSKELLIEEEVRRRKAIKMNLANEGLEARKKEEEIASKKRKAEEEKAWEDNREERVGSWRNFAATQGKKKKKQKIAILG
ncbi:chaperone regulator [Coprinopsis cinerea okayama7|uniref:Chaperone regulator n=1 Tax=Coprinopsis cinerea (strain Okayama-7 / 130 / ATCC MYA-4618 / FGSC 9003) TaxID=240176 RepID=A8NTE7_COPC7|nr:chaperone regulator [Coprinopsis cinerea okayama7\|eukprot:XP_001836210.1 chaperone regulator [Coprinopsis cinerea okayama7\